MVIQHGHTEPRLDEPNVRWIRFGAYAEMAALCEQARAVVSHAGVGSIMTALAAGKQPIVVPRLRRFDEHVDDHQLQIAKQFESQGLVRCLTDAAELPTLLAEPAVAARRPAGAGSALFAEIAADVERHLARPTRHSGGD